MGGQVAPSTPKHALAVGTAVGVGGAIVAGGAVVATGEPTGEAGALGGRAVGATAGVLPPAPPPPHPTNRATTAKTASQRRIYVDGSELRGAVLDAKG
ncbi:MAG TPA: hypothetical protein VMG98_01765 [Verrucomicrobiae bacterium]|nr:hypothetical protein [Verrucomicrobiae bacterium]